MLSYQQHAGIFQTNTCVSFISAHGSTEQKVEWMYAFDIHCNAFFVMFLLTHVLQYLLLPFLLSKSFFASLLANTLHFFGTNSVLVHYAFGLSFHVFFVEDGDVLVPYWYDGIVLPALDFTEFQHDQDYIMDIFCIDHLSIVRVKF